MTSVARLYPPNYPQIPGDLLFDLYDTTAANVGENAYSATRLLGDPNLGTSAFEFNRFAPPQRDGGITTFERAGLTEMRIPLRITASSFDNLNTAIGKLAQIAAAGCTLMWIADSSSVTRYYDIEPSQPTALVGGQTSALYQVLRLFQTPDAEFTLGLVRQPFARGDELDPSDNLFTNATLFIDSDASGRPDGWTWSSTSNITGESIANDFGYQFNIAVAAQRQLFQTTGAATAAPGDIWTLSGYVRATSGAISDARCEALIRYQSSAPADLGTEQTSGLISIGTLPSGQWKRLSVTTSAAPASTDRVKAGLRLNNASASSITIQFRDFKLEEAEVVTPFYVGFDPGTSEPEPASGVGRVFPFVNPGDAEAPVRIYSANTTQGPLYGVLGLLAEASAGGDGVKYISAPFIDSHGALEQIEDWTNGTDTAGNVSATASPGSGTSAKKTTFATTTLVTRASSGGPTLVDAGRALNGHSWLVMLRIAAVDAAYTGVVTFNLTSPRTKTLTATCTALATATGYVDIPMGIMWFPPSAVDAGSLSLFWNVAASRTSGTGNLLWDCVTFVPTDQLGIITHAGAPAATDLAYTDPTIPIVQAVASSLVMNGQMSVEGPVPFLAPPGRSMIYALWGSKVTTVVPNGIAAPRTEALSFKPLLAPRYYS